MFHVTSGNFQLIRWGMQLVTGKSHPERQRSGSGPESITLDELCDAPRRGRDTHAPDMHWYSAYIL